MVRKVGGPTGGEFAPGSSDEASFQVEARHVKETMKEFKGDSLQGNNLLGRVSDGYVDPSNINGRLFHHGD